MPESHRELEALREIAVAVSASRDADEIVAIVCAGARALFRADLGTVALAGPADTLRFPVGGDADLPPRLLDTVEGVVRDGTTRVLRDLPADPGDGLRALVAAPLLHAGEVHGVLAVGWRDPARVPESSVHLAETLGVHTATALHSARLYDELRRSRLARDRFFSAMSHDLRTPIAAIVGYSELLSDGIVGELTDKQHEMVERISQVAAHLSEMVNDILDLAKLDAGRLELHAEPVPLEELVREAVLAVEPQARAKDLPVRLEMDGVGDETVLVDPPRARQILMGLLANAVRFTAEGEVRVTAGITGTRTRVTVRDSGPGLPAGSEEAVFEEFPQLSGGRGRKQETGSGVGLAVSRRLARAMGGDLTVENTPGAGAAFTLHLPLRRG